MGQSPLPIDQYGSRYAFHEGNSFKPKVNPNYNSSGSYNSHGKDNYNRQVNLSGKATPFAVENKVKHRNLKTFKWTEQEEDAEKKKGRKIYDDSPDVREVLSQNNKLYELFHEDQVKKQIKTDNPFDAENHHKGDRVEFEGAILQY